jgi:hypothetical protein
MLGRAWDSGLPNPVLILVHPEADDDGLSAYVTAGTAMHVADICITGDLPSEELADAS